MPIDYLSPPKWVNNSQSLAQMISELSAESRLAVDTESNSLHAYRERVCLIQFSTPAADYLLDPLAFDELDALAPLFANPKTEKIFHAAEYDLICLRRDYGFQFANLFDTMQASRILGYPAVGLDKLLDDKFGIAVNKRHQKADWGARPLSPELIHYARFDTHFLIELRDILEQELREKERWFLALDDFRRACDAEEPRPKWNAALWERYSGRRDLNLRELTVLKELLTWREEVAAQMDRPPFKVMEDDKLILVARLFSKPEADLSQLNLSERQSRLWGEAIFAAARRGAEAPLVQRKRLSRPDEAVIARLDRLKNWRKKIAQEMAVESDIILPKPYVQLLADRAPRTPGDLETLMARSPWRYEKFGSQILEVLGG